jgi:glyoxylase-like metal-dependent hydrolase (beta-lactamase superfamily II)
MAEAIAPGVLQIDTLLGGWERVTAGFLIEGDAPVLVETGSQSSVDTLLAELAALGVGADDLAGIAVTHIHLDHAGGVGNVAQAFPNATVYVHERGARHLADPARLVSSAAMVYGDLLDSLYGRLDPTEASRIKVLEDGEEVRVSANRVLTTVDSPGHAKHHLALHDSESGLLFAGDAVGVRLPDVPASHLYKMIRVRKVRVNGKRAQPEQPLVQGDLVTVRGDAGKLLSAEGGVLEIESERTDDAFEVRIAHPELKDRRMRDLAGILQRFLDAYEITPTRAVLLKRLD